jgi:division protein CdvB (Snf7/Vps24/ESCRT-III family)
MKTSLLAIVILAGAPRAFAIFGVGDIVYDPVNYGVLVETKIETLSQWATAIAKAETQIQNQIQQIQRAESLLNTQNQMRLSIGDWRTVVTKAESIQLQSSNLTKDYNQGMGTSFVVNYGQPTLTYNNHGNFSAVVTIDAFGNNVSVPDAQLKRYAAVETVYENAMTTLQATATETQQNNQEIADTYTAMTQAGITQQEFEKLRGKLQALSVRQQALQTQRQEALAMIQAEDTINRNQQTKEQATSAQVQQSSQNAVANGLAQTQFDAISWR